MKTRLLFQQISHPREKLIKEKLPFILAVQVGMPTIHIDSAVKFQAPSSHPKRLLIFLLLICIAQFYFQIPK